MQCFNQRNRSAAFGIVLAIATAMFATGATPYGQTPAQSCSLTDARTFFECARSVHASRPTREGVWVQPPAGKPLLYASEPFSGVVSISAIESNGLRFLGALTFNGFLPDGLTVDRSRNLYVALLSQSSGQGAVDVFPRGAKQPSKIYTVGLTQPIAVAVGSLGTLYVANFSATSGGCTVVEYAKGSMNPTRVIDGIPGCINDVAVDSANNLYVSYLAYPSGGEQSDILKYAPGSSKGVALGLKAPGGNLFWGVAVDAKGNLVVANDLQVGTLNQILIFPRGSTTPSRTIEYGRGWFPYLFALAGDTIFAPAFMVNLLPSGVPPNLVPAEFDYPSGHERVVESPKTITPGYYFGYAVSP